MGVGKVLVGKRGSRERAKGKGKIEVQGGF